MRIKLSRIEKSLFAVIALLVPAVIAGLLTSWKVGGLGYAMTLFAVLMWIWRPQGRDARGRFMSKMILLTVVSMSAISGGCQNTAALLKPTAPGTITHHRDAQRWQFAPTASASPIVMAVPNNPVADGRALLVIVPLAPQPIAVEQITEQTQVVQPENPASGATLTTDPQQTTAMVPAAYKPALPARAPGVGTSAEKALGGLVWLGGGLVLLGVAGIALRFLPWTMGLGAVVPIGISVLVALAGGLLIAFATVLAAAPWWVIGLCIVGVVLAEGVDPTSDPHKWQRPSVGFIIKATFGYAHYNKDGDLVLGWINEQVEQASCEDAGGT